MSNPFGEFSPDQIRQQLLEQQKMMTFAGTVLCEEGLEVKSFSGFIVAIPGLVVIFGDNSSLFSEQRRSMIPIARVIRIDVDEPA